MVEVLAGRLAWGAKGTVELDWPSEVRFDISHIVEPEFRGGRYEVCHYSAKDCGFAFGPLALDQTLRFAHELKIRLDKEGSRVLCEYEASHRRNAAVLLGAYLVLCEGMSADEVALKLPDVAPLTFPCSWIQAAEFRSKKGQPVMSVHDCWSGIQMARDKRWIAADVLGDEAKTTSEASNAWKSIMEYDGAWVVPGKVFVMADPITVVKDPNPLTCSQLTPSEGSVPSAPADVELVSQEVARKLRATGELDPNWPKPVDFVSYLKNFNVTAIIRTNGGHEPGLKSLGGSYKPSDMEAHGFQHADVYVNDVQGAIPSGGMLKHFLDTVGRMGFSEEEGAAPGRAIAVHCKSGFGRSALFACVLIIYLWDVPGRSLLGWVRIARPGAVVTPEQEMFLRSLSGKADLLEKIEPGKSMSCRCSLQ
jgi:hypothetical protein